MKRIILTLVLVIGTSPLGLFAQEPTTNWPYLFPEFSSGFVSLLDGSTKPYNINIHLRRGRLHFTDENGIIREANAVDLQGASVGDRVFVNVGGTMMEVVAKSPKGCVAAEQLADYDALQETGGAYGVSSTTSATRKLSSIDTDSQINQNYMLLQQSRSEGQMLDIVTRYYLVYPGHQVQASKKEVEKIIPDNRKEQWKAWKKNHKTKWNQPDSLLELLDFLNQ